MMIFKNIFFLTLITFLTLLVSCVDNSSSQDVVEEVVEEEVLMSLLNESEVQEEMTNPIAVIETVQGTIKIELFKDKVPNTVQNFVDLVENGYYDNTKFHRIIANFMIQGGDPLTIDDNKKSLWGTGGPGYEIEDEFAEGLSNLPGTISMANHGPNTGGSQFFINLVDNSFLDYDKQPFSSKHPVFGKVIEGMSVVETLGAITTDSMDRPMDDVILIKVSIEN